MERVTGIGGVFFRSKDPTALAHWYRDHLGIPSGVDGDHVWAEQRGPTVFAPFGEDTDYFGRRDQQAMLNFRVGDLDAMLAQLRASGVSVDEQVTDEGGVGRFGWAVDPEGNRFELWEPADGC